MTLLELVTHLRRNILYDIGGQGVDWSSLNDTDFDSIQLRWNNEELVANINEAIRQVYRRTNPIKDLIQLDITAGSHTFPLPSYVQEILKVKRSTGKYLEEKSMDEFWNETEFNTKTGEPISYFPDVEQGNIRVYPIPLVDETLDLMVYRYAKVDLDWLEQDVEPEIKKEYQIPMLFYAAHLSYLKDEPNAYDPNRSKEMLSYFDREFPFTSVYSNIRKERTTNRPISYGGIQGGRVKRSSFQNRSDRF